MGVQRKHVDELCNNRRAVTAATALILARCSVTAPTSGSVSSGGRLGEAMNDPRERERIERARPLGHAA